ncbi:hypothetical protein PY254_10685 [Rhodanobacter sp. AS-Z3]|jgi:hypothetical protein|uniref:hypothetical protein n=1 Tax=Rhodanobacter sp. AS-Z3 TaxID=3031330 RepID=UPI00247982A3|nr:hypothetical protein [Rhodanobacter sp. AS-Z3]WEN13711.1 hypothetical protein PY254_10685 [Rhodanobacter sp. AS-Z3]
MMIEIRASAFLGGVYSTAAAAATWTSPLEFVGLPAPVLFMAFAGVAFGLILQPPKTSRTTMFLLVLAYTFFSAVATVMVGGIPHMEWAQASAPAIAGFLGVFAQVVVPAARNRLTREVQDRGNSSNGGAP